MRPKILLTLLLGGCAGLTVVVLSLRAPRLDTSVRDTVSPELGEPYADPTSPALPTPAVPPLPPSSEPRKPATPLTARVALGGFLRKVVWEPDRDEPIDDATIRVILAAPTGTEEELGRCTTDARGAFTFEAELSYGRLPAALRLRPEKAGWAEAWAVSGLPLAVDSLPHSRRDLVWHMTRASATVDSAGSQGRAVRLPEDRVGENLGSLLDPSSQPARWRSYRRGATTITDEDWFHTASPR